jgi:hypothetical protein
VVGGEVRAQGQNLRFEPRPSGELVRMMVVGRYIRYQHAYGGGLENCPPALSEFLSATAGRLPGPPPGQLRFGGASLPSNRQGKT